MPLKNLQTRQKDVVGKVVDGDDWQIHTHGPTIIIQIRARVAQDLMALVGEKRCHCSQKPPISIRGGIINESDGGGGAAKG